MSVFTPLQQDEVERFLAGYDVGKLISYQGIQGGSENTNYFVNTLAPTSDIQQRWVLTLIERGPVDELTFFVDLLDVLHKTGLSVPYALPDGQGQRIQHIKGRPALLQPCLMGEHPTEATEQLCHALGAWLATMHTATEKSPLKRQSDRHPHWVVTQAQSLLHSHWKTHETWLSSALDDLSQWLQSTPALPVSIIHGDLFRDNAMVSKESITGVIDFYNAYRGWTLMDIAICVNDWCIDIDAEKNPQVRHYKLNALLSGYQSVRALTDTETEHWLVVLQLAALRFWVSRQVAWIPGQKQQHITVKDPEPFGRLFKYYRHLQLSHGTELNW